MTRQRFVRALGGLVGLMALAFMLGHCRSRIRTINPPDVAAQQWALDALNAARLGETRPEPPASANYEPAGPIFVIAWRPGHVLARHVGGSSLVEAVDEAVETLLASDLVTSQRGWASTSDEDRVRFTVEVTTGEGPIDLSIPYVAELSLVPLHEGLMASHGEQRAYVTPEELRARGAFDSGVSTPIPDLRFGVEVDSLIGRLARDLGLESDELERQGEVRRFRAFTISESTYPRSVEVTEDELRLASVEGAEFLLRHQRRNGTYTYVYDGPRARSRPEPYNLPRHSGTTYFLAQVDRLHGSPEARQGAIRALRWLQRNHIRRCGDHPCVESHGMVNVGSAALTVVAATEVLAAADDPTARQLAEGLTGFLRAQQREDGELMHEYDLAHQRPIDVQHMYYSGEAAFALFKAHEVLGDERDLEAAQMLMKHLTGAGWNFLGSRYYYGEEHWTCIAAGEARGRVDEADGLTAADFCGRWFTFNDRVQYRDGETPWASTGAYGVGPVLVPRLTPVGSRTEAFVSTYQLFKHHGQPTDSLRALIERGLGALLRWRWSPGPQHLLGNPIAARGGMPGSPVELRVRNDYVQHAGSAMIRWADVLKSERNQ